MIGSLDENCTEISAEGNTDKTRMLVEVFKGYMSAEKGWLPSTILEKKKPIVSHDTILGQEEAGLSHIVITSLIVR
jgi:hypothetical protein